MALSINENTLILRLPYIRNNWEYLISEAKAKELSYEDFLDSILKYEIEERTIKSIQKKTRKAKFPYKFTLQDFKRDHLSVEIKQKINELERLNFINNNENIILVGNPGVGKTALAIALGLQACLEGYSVLFISVPQLLIEVQEAMSKSEYLRYKKKFEKYNLVILDELGYSSFNKDSGEILFNLLSSRNENKSLIITSNLTMDRWNEVFNDMVLTGAIVDRLANRAHMINMTGDSYRIKQTQEWIKNQKQINTNK